MDFNCQPVRLLIYLQFLVSLIHVAIYLPRFLLYPGTPNLEPLLKFRERESLKFQRLSCFDVCFEIDTAESYVV